MNIDPDGRVSFDKATYDRYCDKGACPDGYNPEPMKTAALTAWGRASCRQWWSSAFTGGPTLANLIVSSSPRVYFADLPEGVGGIAYGSIILDCKHARCNDTPNGAKISAGVLIHELVHIAQTYNYGPIPGLLMDTENDPARGARPGASICAPQ